MISSTTMQYEKSKEKCACCQVLRVYQGELLWEGLNIFTFISEIRNMNKQNNSDTLFVWE